MTTAIFRNKYWSILWTALRVLLGYEWLEAGWEKVAGANNALWVGSKAGTAVSGFLKGAVANSIVTPKNPHPSVEAWYAWFVQNIALPNAKAFSYLVAYGEVLVGLGLIFGALTTIALYAGALMNLSYMLAGSAGVNPRMYTMAIILLVVGASAYTIGVDRYLMPWLKNKLGFKNTPPAT